MSAQLSIHRVKKVSVLKSRKELLENDSKQPYCVTEFEITTENGERITVTLFSDEILL